MPPENPLFRKAKERITKTLDGKIREGKPFTAHDIISRATIEILAPDPITPEQHDEAVTRANMLANQVMRLKAYRGRIWKRYNRSTMSIEKTGPAGFIRYYPSNDRDRFHLKEYEVFCDVGETHKNAPAELEPPVRIDHRDDDQPIPYVIVEHTIYDNIEDGLDTIGEHMDALDPDELWFLPQALSYRPALTAVLAEACYEAQRLRRDRQ